MARSVRIRVSPWQAVQGILVAAVPALASFFPEEISHWPLIIRILIGIAWLGVLIWFIVTATDVGTVLDSHLKKAEQAKRARALMIGMLTLDQINVAMKHYFDQQTEMIVYEWNKEAKQFAPIWPPRPKMLDDPRVFTAGCGATGSAFDNLSYVHAMGSSVHTAGEYGLTEEQADYYQQYNTVVAEPIFGIDAQSVGVVTLLHKNQWPKEFVERHHGYIVTLAEIIGNLLTAPSMLETLSHVRDSEE